MLKQNSRISLLALTHPSVIRQGVPEEFFQALLSELTPSGYQSLLSQLTGKELLWYERRPLGKYVGATEKGKRELLDIFPALQTQEADSWHLLVFTRAPKADPQFRNLNEQLHRQRWLKLSRGVYAHPFKPSSQITVLLDTFYSDSVMLSTVAEWKIGFKRAVIVREYGLEALSDLYSGIGSECYRLLTTFSHKKGLNYKSILSIKSVIARFESALGDDAGLLPQVFQGSDNAYDIYGLIARLVQAGAASPLSQDDLP